MKTKFTPGPFEADGTKVLDGHGFCLTDAQETVILAGWPERHPDAKHWSRKPGETYRELAPGEAEANARLWAAAPELAAALASLYDAVLNPDRMSGVLMDKCEAALRKAGVEL